MYSSDWIGAAAATSMLTYFCVLYTGLLSVLPAVAIATATVSLTFLLNFYVGHRSTQRLAGGSYVYYTI